MRLKRWGLRTRITLWLVAYASLLALAVLVHGHIVNRQAEQATWRSLLQSELEHFLRRSAEDPQYRWAGSGAVQLYGDDEDLPAPTAFAQLTPGIHEDLVYQGRDKVLLVQDVAGKRLVLVLDITEAQKYQSKLGLWMLASNIVAIVVFGGLVLWGLGRVVRPLSEMAARIHALRPDKSGQRIAYEPGASREQVVIADALNDYLARNDLFVERERAFIDSASHELRTPIAVIGGASELALEQPAIPAAVRQQLLRIRQTSSSVEQLISMLLVLAKDPARLARSSDYLRLDHLLPDIVDDHSHLSAAKDLQLLVEPLPQCELFAPMAILQAAIGNLLRNAIENSDRGVIRIQLLAPALVRIEDPGHGMSPEEVSAFYARMARGQARQGSGIGLELIARLCEHLGWQLQLDSSAGQGTLATLDMSAALARGPRS